MSESIMSFLVIIEEIFFVNSLSFATNTLTFFWRSSFFLTNWVSIVKRFPSFFSKWAFLFISWMSLDSRRLYKRKWIWNYEIYNFLNLLTMSDSRLTFLLISAETFFWRSSFFLASSESIVRRFPTCFSKWASFWISLVSLDFRWLYKTKWIWNYETYNFLS